MRTGRQTHRRLSSARPCLASAGILFFALFMDLALTRFAVPPPEPSVPAVSKVPSPRSFRTAAERAGNLAAMHEGPGSGVQVQMRGGHASPTFARRLQTETAQLNSARVRETLPSRPDRIGTPVQTFLFQLFPRCFLPVRAGPLPA